ncbi:Bacterial type II secretion system protein F domain protein [Methyloligella halotolerans]|uniref:Bacterial type II secretion system protein F domain protein n=1 Tax=Methyloligella halotolerans TaxID=1177755 RepID=A0A1E2RVZ0_9HYPH|nr:type II secretion system F family protein [Methyloligella halotolerans]ODA66394.1 Bacterial type II secretion system protein F domain protein [Methyloligella halotolerans]
MDILYLLLDRQVLIMVLVAIAAFATVATLIMPFFAADRLGSRMKYVAGERERLREQRMAEFAEQQREARLRQDPRTFMKRVVDRLNLRKALETEETHQRLKMAGLRGQAPVVAFLFFRATLPLVTFGCALFYLFFVTSYQLGGVTKFCIAIGAAYIGFYLPNIFITNLIQKRQKSIRQAFPDALDLLLICVQSGMSIEAAMNKVSQEMGTQSLELAEEFALTTAELSYLPQRRQAYENLGKRTGVPAVKAVGTSLLQAERYGTGLGQALRVMAKESRDARMIEAEKKAAALPPKLTVPMILFFLPVLFIVILGPAVIQVLAVWK